jgi:DtxR family Mn-dependent transcriptional regulator
MPTVAKLQSRAAEDYLKAIYTLQRSSSPVSTTALAGTLGRSAASVTNMVKSLADQGLLEHVPYHGVRLTETGQRSALQIIRRHRVSGRYLIEQLGYTWEAVHAEAERLEQAAEFDPHGAPIPTADGSVSERSLVSLGDLRPGEAARVRQVADTDSGLLMRLQNLGLCPSARIVLQSDPEVADSLRLEVEGAVVVLEPALVAALLVERER